jgi:sugar phosphate isomerase/epimerase
MNQFGLHYFELQTPHFLSTDPYYIARFNDRLKKAKCRISNICLELDDADHKYSGLVGPGSADPALRAKGVELTKKWIDIAASIGSPTVMANQTSTPLVDNFDTCIEALKAMEAYGKTKNVAVTVENRGRATPEQLAKLIQTAGIHANPDLGNFADEETRARGNRDDRGGPRRKHSDGELSSAATIRVQVGGACWGWVLNCAGSWCLV